MLGAGLTSLPAPGVSPSTRGCHSLPRALGRAKVTAQGARGDRWVSLGVALSCWHTGRAAALPPPSPAGSSCSAPAAAPASGVHPGHTTPLSHRSLPLFSAFFRCHLTRPNLYFPSPAPAGSSPQTPAQLRLFPAPAGDKTTDPRTFLSPRNGRETPKKTNKSPAEAGVPELRC